MKRGIVLFLATVLLAVVSKASGNLSNAEETRDLTGFTKISFGVSGDLIVNIGDEYKVVLEGDNSLVDNIKTDVSSGRLTIKKDNWRLNMNEKVTIYVTLPRLEGISVSGSGRAEIKDAVRSEDLSLNVSGSGKIYTSDLIAGKVSSSISGSGDIILGGNSTIDRTELTISGSGSFKGEAAKTSSMGVVISGSGSCSCSVSESLRATISGSGNVTYTGNPKIDARVSGSGRVRSR